MSEIKNQFTGGKMNKDLDERLVPKGEYRDAMNIQVSTSEGSDVGAVQNILGNTPGCVYNNTSTNPLYQKNPIQEGSSTVGSISDEKNDSLYWLIAGPNEELDMSTFQATPNPSGGFIPNTISFKDMIMRTNGDTSIAPSGCEPVFVDQYKWCSTLSPATTSSLTDVLVFDDTSLYSNITAGMQATGFSGSSIAWGPRSVISVGGLKTISVNYNSNTTTQTNASSAYYYGAYIRTFEKCVAPPPTPGFELVMSSLVNTNVHLGSNNCPQGVGGSGSFPASTNLPSYFDNIQLLVPAIDPNTGAANLLPPEVVPGANVDFIGTVSSGNNVYTNGTIVSVTSNVNLDPTYAFFPPNPPGGSNKDYYVIEISHDLTTGSTVDLSQLIPTFSTPGNAFPSQVFNYEMLEFAVTANNNTVVPDSTICVPATSQQWLNEIYQVLFEPGTTNLTGFNFQIDNSVGAGGLWPPNSCIDPQSVIDPLGSVVSGSGVFSLGPPIVYNTCFSIVQCNTSIPVTPSGANTSNLELSFVIPSQGAGPIDAIYLDKSVDMQGVDAVCFESDRVLNFDSSRLITGINIVDDMLFWTDNFSEPKKINITRSIEGTDPVGNRHTAVINSATGLSLSNYNPIREEHITVIKKAPKSALTMDLKAARNPRKNYSGIVTISGDANLADSSLWPQVFDIGSGGSGNPSYPYDFSTFTTDEGSNIIYIQIRSDLDLNTNFSLDNWKVGSKVVLKEFDANGNPPQIPINDYTIKGTIITWDYNNSDANRFSTTPPDPWGVKVAIKVTSISRPPQIAATSTGTVDFAIDLFDESEKLFEFKFPRFSYRYKYEDGEYSTFAPFTSVAFLPGSFDYHAKKGYNLGMTNSISHLWLRNYITSDMPLDVVQIDLLYKEDDSPNVYIIESLRPDSEPNIKVFSSLYTSWALNSFKIDKDNIKAVIPSNQLLRPYDNVPKKALAQEVTGSRVVYGNYYQNYDLIAGGLQYNPLFQAITVEDTSSVRSIKSLREYQLGVVFTDKYGRETPVISNNSATFKIEKSEGIKKNKLQIRLDNSNAPLDMEYFKFYIKETSGEYYNMAMDRYYDAEDGNIWVSFASSDRNKIDIDTFLILKKGVDSNELIEDPARFKVIAIENEAPDFIKINKTIISDIKHESGTTTQNVFLTGDKLPTVDKKFFSLAWWDGANHIHSNTSVKNIHESTDDTEYYFQIVNIDGSESSIPMKIAKIDITDDLGTASSTPVDWAITLEKPFGNDILKFTDSPNDASSVTKIEDGNRCVLWSYKKENSAKFDGRFFVKIFEEDTFTNYIVNNPTSNLSATNYISAGISQKMYSFRKATHNFVNVGSSGTAPQFPAGKFNFTLTSANNGNTPDIGDYIASTNQTGTDHGNSGSSWLEHAAFFRGLNFHRSEDSPAGTAPRFEQYAINMRKASETMDLHSPGNITGTDELEFEDVWFVDGKESKGEFTGEWGGSYNSNTFQPSGISISSNTGFIDIGFGGIQPTGSRDSSGSLIEWTWNSTYTGISNDPSFYDLSANYHYSNNSDASIFAGYLKSQQIWAWEEDPTQEIYVFTSQQERNLLRHESNPDLYEQYQQARGNQAALNYSIYNAIQYQQSTFYRPGNYSKNYRLSFQNHVDPSKVITWDPYSNFAQPIPGGLEISLNIDPSHTNVGPHNNEIRVTDIVGNDPVYNSKSIHVGMVWDVRDNSSPASGWTASTEQFDYGAVISEIEYDSGTSSYILRLKQYNPRHPKMAGAFPSLTAGSSVIVVKQFGMNGISRNSAKNINRWNNGVGFNDTEVGVDAVGYTMEMKDISSTSTEAEFPRFPAIFETEPKEQTDLDIYYEISDNIPTELNPSNISSILPVGSPIEVRSQDPGVGNLGNGIIPFDVGITISNNTWQGTGKDVIITGAYLGPENIAGGLNAVTPVLGDKLIVKKPDGTIVEIEILSMGNTGVSPLQTTFKLNGNLLRQNITSNWHNCYSFGNGVESNRIRDNFNLPFIKNGVKVSTTLDQDYKEEHRKHGLIYSGIYNSNSGVNNLNQFIQAEKITKDINPIYGSIQKLHSGWGQSGDLVTLCEDRVLKILANKDALFNADGDTNVTSTNKVLGTATPYSGEFGISKNPESFASEAYRAYFTDKVRGAVIRLSMDGLTAISDHGMKDWFRDNLKLSNRLIGSYDDKKDEYNITLDQPDRMVQTGSSSMIIVNDSTTVTFKENVKGWVSFKSFIPEHANSCANEYYTYLDGNLWRHHVEVIDPITNLEIDRNTFYSQFTPSSLKVVLNDLPGSVKTFHTLNYEGTQSKIDEFREYDTIDPLTSTVRDHYNFTDPDPNFSNQQIGYYNLKDVPGWYVDSIVTNLEEGGVPEFINKEGKWFNYIRGKTGSIIDGNSMSGNIAGGYNNADFSFQGIARASNVTLSQVLGCQDPTQFNYNPLATAPDPNNPCMPFVYGCTDPNADANYNASANTDDGSCEYYGCTDPTATNYDPNATQDPNLECIYPTYGCTDSSAMNYDPNATVDDGSCTYCVYGCMDASATNYNPLATCDDGSCTYPVYGCTNPVACNFDPLATVDDGTCDLNSGCTDPNSCNYDASATCDNGSCTYCNDTASNVMNYSPLASCSTYCVYCEAPIFVSSSVTSNSITLDWNAAPAPSAPAVEYRITLHPSTSASLPHPTGPAINSFLTTSTNYTITGLTPNTYYAVYIEAICQNGPVISGSTLTPGFLTNTAPVSGCTDSTANNYDPNATIDDGSCTYNSGCTDPLACNYDPTAVIDDGSCVPFGCTDPNYVQYDPSILLTCSDSSMCLNLCVDGCTDPTQSNYNALATCDDGSCIPFTFGCMDPLAMNYNSQATADDGSCLYPGCTDNGSDPNFPGRPANYTNPFTNGPEALNYDANANFDDGTCIYSLLGCTDPNATNYVPLATIDDGSCTYTAVNGCTHPNALNYDPNATVDDGSCELTCPSVILATTPMAFTPPVTAGCPEGWCTTANPPNTNPFGNGPYPQGGSSNTLFPYLHIETVHFAQQSSCAYLDLNGAWEYKVVPPGYSATNIPYTGVTVDVITTTWYLPSAGFTLPLNTFTNGSGTYEISVKASTLHIVPGSGATIQGWWVQTVSFNATIGCMSNAPGLNYDPNANIHDGTFC